MSTYAKLKNGEIMIVWRDDPDRKEMELYPLDRQHNWNPKVDENETHSYDNIIAKSDVFLSLLTPKSKFFKKNQ